MTTLGDGANSERPSKRRKNAFSNCSATVKSETKERGCANGLTTIERLCDLAEEPTPNIRAGFEAEIAISGTSAKDSPDFTFRTDNLSGENWT